LLYTRILILHSLIAGSMLFFPQLPIYGLKSWPANKRKCRDRRLQIERSGGPNLAFEQKTRRAHENLTQYHCALHNLDHRHHLFHFHPDHRAHAGDDHSTLYEQSGPNRQRVETDRKNPKIGEATHSQRLRQRLARIYLPRKFWRLLTSLSTSSAEILLTCIGPAQIYRHGAPAKAWRTMTSKTWALTPEP